MKKALVLFLTLSAIGLPLSSRALTREDILAQIQVLLQQVQFLQQQANQLNTGGYGYGNYGGACSTFSYNLGIGSSESDVSSLQNILQSEGFTVSSYEISSSYYGPSTAAAVSAFQEKYYSEILAPFGLFRGTGRVGAMTRAKLNQLNTCCGQNTYNPYNSYPTYPYNNTTNNNCCPLNSYPYGSTYPYNNNYPCNTNPYNPNPYNPTYPTGAINIISPAGGEQFQPGGTMSVSWSYSDYYNRAFAVELWKGGQYITRMTVNNTNSLSFNLPSYLSYGSDYFIKVYDQSNQSVTGTSRNFTVGYGTTSGSGVTVLGPNGGEQLRIGMSYPIQFSVNTTQNITRARIELWQNGYVLGVITDGLPIYQNQTQTQTYSWIAGNYSDSSGFARQAPVGSGYSIRISVHDSSGQLISSDNSNSYFFISQTYSY